MGILLPGAFCLLYIKQVRASPRSCLLGARYGGTSRWLANAGRVVHQGESTMFVV